MVTIGIIRVVAALTIPILGQNSNSKKFSSLFNKSVSTLSQSSIMSMAQYDVDFSLLNTASSASTCATDSLSAGKSTMCGLLNSTLAGHTYLGVYGDVSGLLPFTKYSFRTVSEGFDPSGYLLYSMSDGVIFGFNPNISRCSLAAGATINNDSFGAEGSLANCLGFIDVNGANGPNYEIECKKPSRDVYLIVFHDGAVEPASDAARYGGDCLTKEELEALRLAKRRDFTKWKPFEITQPLTKA